MTEFFEKLEKNIRINYLGTRIVKLFVVELYCTHTAACIFYYLATTVPPAEEGYTWIGSLKLGDYSYSHFREIDLWKRYVTSLYFAIVTMATVGKLVHISLLKFKKKVTVYLDEPHSRLLYLCMLDLILYFMNLSSFFLMFAVLFFS